jgi:hypothetical protein
MTEHRTILVTGATGDGPCRLPARELLYVICRSRGPSSCRCGARLLVVYSGRTIVHKNGQKG